jgi:hypothetical protein
MPIAFVLVSGSSWAAPAASFEAFRIAIAQVEREIPVAQDEVVARAAENEALRARINALALATLDRRADLDEAETAVREFVTTDLDNAVALYRAVVARMEQARDALGTTESELAQVQDALLRGEVGLNAAELAAARLIDKRLVLRAENELHFAPPRVMNLTLRASSAGGSARLFRVEWTVDDADPDATVATNVELLRDMVEEAARAVETLTVSYEFTKNQFVAADARWHDLNRQYSNAALAQLIAAGTIELADFATGAAQAAVEGGFVALGPYVLFELAWRGREFYEGGGFLREGAERLVQEPSLGDDFLAYRDALSKEDRLSARGLVSSELPDVSWLDGQGMEALKGVVGNTIDSYAQLFAEEKGQAFLLQQMRERGTAAVLHELTTTTQGPINAALKGYQDLGGERFREIGQAVERLTKGAPGDFSNAIGRFTNPQVIRKTLTGFATGAGFTLFQAGTAHLGVSVREQIYLEMAHAELDWFLRRNALRAVSAFLQHYKTAHTHLQTRLGEALDRQAVACCDRILKRTDTPEMSEPVIIGDWHRAGLKVEVEFSKPVQGATMRFGDSIPVALSATDSRSILGADLRQPFGPGRVVIEMGGTDDNGLALDGAPNTIATLDPDFRWQDYELAPDRSIALTVIVPAVVVAGVPAGGIVAGQPFLGAVTNAPDGTSLIVIEADAPEVANVRGGTSRHALADGGNVDVDLDAPRESGAYEVRLIDGPEVGHGTLAVDELNVIATTTPCQPRSGPGASLVSMFSQGADGWLIEGDAGPDPVLEAGEISATDLEDGEVWYWKAPPKYSGDHSGALGGTLTYRLRTTEVTRQFDAADVVIEGGGLTLTLDAVPNPGLGTTEYRMALGTASPWMLGDAAATEEQICQVLSAMTALKIRGEYETGPDTGWLGLVRFGY